MGHSAPVSKFKPQLMILWIHRYLLHRASQTRREEARRVLPLSWFFNQIGSYEFIQPDSILIDSRSNTGNGFPRSSMIALNIVLSRGNYMHNVSLLVFPVFLGLLQSNYITFYLHHVLHLIQHWHGKVLKWLIVGRKCNILIPPSGKIN